MMNSEPPLPTLSSVMTFSHAWPGLGGWLCDHAGYTRARGLHRLCLQPGQTFWLHQLDRANRESAATAIAMTYGRTESFDVDVFFSIEPILTQVIFSVAVCVGVFRNRLRSKFSYLNEASINLFFLPFREEGNDKADRADE